MPVVAGATFTVLNPMIIIANSYGERSGLPVVYGALLCSGVFGLIIAKAVLHGAEILPAAGHRHGHRDDRALADRRRHRPDGGQQVQQLRRRRPRHDDGERETYAEYSTATGSVVTTMNTDSGQISHILLAAAVIVMIILITRVFSGFIGQTAVLISIIIGCFIAWPMGLMKFTSVGSAKWFGISPPFHFGHPKFEAAAIISMCIVVLVTYTESTADMLAVSEMVDKKLSPSDLARGLATDGLSALLAGFMNSFPDTACAENVGLIAMTRVRSRWVVTVCGAALIILGLVPKVGTVVADLPGPVIGGAATVMFALVTAIGIKTLNKTSFDGNHNLLIVAVALSFGLIPVIQPSFYMHFPQNFQVIFGSSITSTVIVVFVLNLVFNHWHLFPREREGAVETALEHGAVALSDEPVVLSDEPVALQDDRG
jgi:NCS2 family nucleobase:cation symporter-2